MKRIFMAVAIVVLVFTLPATLTAQMEDPATIVMDQTEAFKRGDYDSALAYYAEDAVYQLEYMDEAYTGKEQIRAWWDELIAQNFDLEVDVLNVDGNAVTTSTKTWVDFTRELGIAPLEATEVYIVEDGKITLVTWTPTEEAIAKLEAVMSVPEAMPESGAEIVPGYLLALILGGLVIVLGAGLAWRYR